MGRALLVLWNDDMRAKAKRWIDKAPPETRVEYKGPKRTLPQSAKMWAMLTDISEQATWQGKRRTTENWKDLFTAALKATNDGLEIVPGLEGGFMILGMHTSDLSIAEMADLITYMDAWGAEHGVVFTDPKLERAA